MLQHTRYQSTDMGVLVDTPAASIGNQPYLDTRYISNNITTQDSNHLSVVVDNRELYDNSKLGSVDDHFITETRVDNRYPSHYSVPSSHTSRLTPDFLTSRVKCAGSGVQSAIMSRSAHSPHSLVGVVTSSAMMTSPVLTSSGVRRPESARATSSPIPGNFPLFFLKNHFLTMI